MKDHITKKESPTQHRTASILAFFSSLMMVSVSTTDAEELGALEMVELDQVESFSGKSSIFNRNIALGRMSSLVHGEGYFGHLFPFGVQDGISGRSWRIENRHSSWVDTSWGLAVPVNQIDLIGVRGVRNYKLELHDGEKWAVVDSGGKIDGNKKITFPPRPASSLRFGFDTINGSAEIREIEVYNTSSKDPLPQYGSRELIEAMETASAVVLFDGSPFGFSRSGVELIRSPYQDVSLRDAHIKPVVRYICSRLGGTVKDGKGEVLEIELNGKRFKINTDPKASILGQLKSFAELADLEFHYHDSLLIIGKRLFKLTSGPFTKELTRKIGANPAIGRWDQAVTDKPDAVITPAPAQAGKTYQWAGLRYSGTLKDNSAAWFNYTGVKSTRSWVGSQRYMKPFVKTPSKVNSLEEFEGLKSRIRANPENSGLVDVAAFVEKNGGWLDEEFGIYNDLGLEVINCTGPKTWADNWDENYREWAAMYSMVYHLASRFDVAAHQYGNEPDNYLNQLKTEELVAFRLMLMADAVHCAITDVNRDDNKQLKAIYSAPVLASNFTGRTARVMMRNLRTRYDGKESPSDLVQLFNRHRYSDRARQNISEVEEAKKMMVEEAGRALPQVFTELNVSTGGAWAKSKGFTSDTPGVYSAMASIWGRMMETQEVYGIFHFKFSALETTPLFNNTITYSATRETDPGVEQKKEPDVIYTTKNCEVTRLFGRGFHGSRPLLKTNIECSDLQYKAYTALDEKRDCYYIWSVQANNDRSYNLEFDFNELGVPEGAVITAEAVSSAQHGEIVARIELPASKKIRLRQPAQSAMLLTVSRRRVDTKVLTPVADSTAFQGEFANQNTGDRDVLAVRRNSGSVSNAVTYMKFKLPEDRKKLHEAVLELHGQSVDEHAYDGGFMIRIYNLVDQKWVESQLTGANAPNLYKTVSSAINVDMANFPVGHMTCFKTPGKMASNVTSAVEDATKRGDDYVSIMVIREMQSTGEDTDASWARLDSREAGEPVSPKLYLYEN